MDNVISLDKDRITMTDNLVFKKSSRDEYLTLMRASELCKKMEGVNVPKVYDYSDGVICMERCFGKNIELMLRNMDTYNEGVNYINYLLNYFIDNKFFWKDFAPRNILKADDKFYIMDFERGIASKDISLKSYLRDSVYEEYGAFILPEDRIFNMNDVFEEEDSMVIYINSISSKRIKEIVKRLGYKDKVPLSIYALAIKMIVMNEEPFIKDGQIVFPLLELEDYVKENGREEYAKKIIGGYNVKVRSL